MCKFARSQRLEYKFPANNFSYKDYKLLGGLFVKVKLSEYIKM